MDSVPKKFILHLVHNFLNSEVEPAIRERRVKLAFVGLMAAIDMTVKNLLGEGDKKGFERFCKDFLAKKNPDYGKSSTIDDLWRLRVALTHNWGSKTLFYVLPDLTPEERANGILDPRTHSHLVRMPGGGFGLSLSQFYEDVEDVLLPGPHSIIDFVESDSIREKDAIARIKKLLS